MTDQIVPPALPAPPANAGEAQNRLDALTADKAWSEKLLSGDAATTKEFHDLATMVADGGDHVERALAGNLPDVPDSKIKTMNGTVAMLRELGIRDEVIRQTLEDHEVTQAEYDATLAWQTRAMKDQFWVKAYLEGDPDAARQMMLATIVLSSTVKREAA